jgi:hypothetical protein
VKPAQPAAAQAAPVERPAEPTQAAEHSMQQPAAVPAPPRPPAQRPATAATARPGAAPPARSTPTQAASLPPPQPRASGSGQAKLLMGPPLARLSSRPPQIGQGPAQGSSTANAVVTRVAVPLAPPAPPVAGEVFVVGPTSELDPGRYGSQTACVGGENVLLGRSIFANSMIVPDHNRAAALKLGLCQVIMVTRRPDAEAARRMLSNMGVTADIRQK